MNHRNIRLVAVLSVLLAVPCFAQDGDASRKIDLDLRTGMNLGDAHDDNALNFYDATLAVECPIEGDCKAKLLVDFGGELQATDISGELRDDNQNDLFSEATVSVPVRTLFNHKYIPANTELRIGKGSAPVVSQSLYSGVFSNAPISEKYNVNQTNIVSGSTSFDLGRISLGAEAASFNLGAGNDVGDDLAGRVSLRLAPLSVWAAQAQIRSGSALKNESAGSVSAVDSDIRSVGTEIDLSSFVRSGLSLAAEFVERERESGSTLPNKENTIVVLVKQKWSASTDVGARWQRMKDDPVYGDGEAVQLGCQRRLSERMSVSGDVGYGLEHTTDPDRYKGTVLSVALECRF